MKSTAAISEEVPIWRRGALIVGGGVQLGPLGTAATNRPIVPTPGDYVMKKLVE
jgi:hypothetical protein